MKNSASTDRTAWWPQDRKNLLRRHYTAWPLPRQAWPSRRVYRAKYIAAYEVPHGQ